MKITADEGPSYSSPLRTVDLRAKVMQQLQQAFGHRRRASACMRVCHNHLQLQPVTPSPFFLSISLRHLSPLSFFFLSSVMLRSVHAQNTQPHTSFCIYHTCRCSLLAWHQTQSERAIWFAFLSTEADQLWPLCQHMK